MTAKKLPVKIVVYAILACVVLLVAFPLYITIVTAFKTQEQSAKNFFALPSSLYLDNFKEVMADENFWHYVVNSVGITVVAVVAIAVVVPLVSFSIARNMKHSRYYKFIYVLIIFSIFTPFQTLMVPLTKMCSSMNLMNQVGIVLIYIAFGLGQGVFLFVGYYKSIPIDLEEAAMLDGCTLSQTFFKIVFPIAKPMTATVVILDTLWIWNDFQLPLLILNKSATMWTMPLYQYNFKSAYTNNYNLAFASFMFSIVPMIIVYICMQKNIIAGLTAGAVKS